MNTFFESVLASQAGWAGLVLRVGLGGVIFPHGAQKLLGWYGGYGFKGTMQFFTETMHLPWLVGLSVILLESVGALFLIAGFGTRVWALGYVGLFIGIILTSHLQNGFFMNWFGNQKGEGFEFALLVIAMAITLVLGGGGHASVDGLLLGKSKF
jgi:putative oxidoreductase